MLIESHVVLYLAIVLVSATITTALGLYPLRQKPEAIASPFAFLMLCATFWSITAAMEIISNDAFSKAFWLDVKFSVISMAPIAWLALALQYSGKEKWLHWRRFALLSTISVIATILFLTNSSHHLMFSQLAPETIIGIIVLNPSFTPLLLAHAVYSLGLLLLCAGLFFDALQRAPESYKGQAVALISSLLIPMAVAAAYALRISPLFPLDPMPTTFVVSGGIVVWSLFRHQLFDITPVARDKVIESMGDGMVVVEAKGRIVDLNPLAQRVIQSSQSTAENRIIGELATHVLRAWPNWATCFSMTQEARTEISVGEGAAQQIYDVDISPLTDQRQQFLGWVAILRDITEQKQTHVQLQAQYAEIKELHARLADQAIRDPLTNLYNRRYLEETLEREFSRASRSSYPVSLIMIDIDHFKRVNDTFGHLAGDVILQTLAVELCSQARASDIACRYGGEEFVVVLPNVTLEIACQRAEQWRQCFDTLRVKYGDAELQSTLSLGVAAYPIHGATSGEVLDIADRALYAAKTAGRNCVRVATA